MIKNILLPRVNLLNCWDGECTTLESASDNLGTMEKPALSTYTTVYKIWIT